MDGQQPRLQRVETSAAPVREKVAHSIREAIVLGRYAPGQRLIERELCESTGVSRTSVREALRQLESEGLVELLPHRGPIVATVDAADAAELYELRGALEALAGRLCARRAAPSHVEEMRTQLDRMELALDRGDLGGLLVLKDGFYAALFAGAQNSALVRVLTGLHGRITFLRSQTLGSPDRPRQAVGELAAIAVAIAEGDEEAAAAACAAHVESAAALAVASLESGDAAGATPGG